VSQQMMVFVSHAHEDDTFCRAVVEGMRGAGADIWYDEHNLGSGQLMDVIQQELGRRPIVVVILSKAAFASLWVRREVTWAFHLLDRDPSRLILPVTGGSIERNDFDPTQGWLFLEDFKRIEAPGLQPYPPEEAVHRLLHALALTPAGEAPAPTAAPQPTENAEALLARGKALSAQMKYAEALPLFQRATQLAPRSFDAWANLGLAYSETGQHGPDIDAYDRALALDAQQAWVWTGKSSALRALGRNEEAQAAHDRATTLAPTFTFPWNGNGNALPDLKRHEEAYEQALTLDPTNALAWYNKGDTLYKLNRYEEALLAYNREFDRNDPMDWRAHALVYRALGRTAEAKAAERRAKELES
jgi:Tfp pilus assembly protein PilF